MKEKEYKKDLVSIVIPTYNQEDFIAKTLTSVLDQTYSDLEVIVADDCSTDSTVEIVMGFAQRDNRIRLLLAEKNRGIPNNFNKAFDEVNGEFVAFLGGDDVMFPTKIEKLIHILKTNPEAGLVYSDMELYNVKTNETRLQSDKGIHNQPLDWALKVDWYLEKDTGILPSACVARSEYYLQARYDERFYLKHELWFTLEDYYQNPQMKWLYHDEVLGRYYIHENNFSRTDEANSKIIEETFMVADFCAEKYPESRDRVKEHLEYFTFKNLLLNNDVKDAFPRFLIVYENFSFKRKMHLHLSRLFRNGLLRRIYFKIVRKLKFI